MSRSILAAVLAVAGAVTSVVGILSGLTQMSFIVAFIGGVVFVAGGILLVLTQLKR